MFLKRRGSITVFICIVLVVLVPLCCILTDLARFSMARKQAETALKTCAESMLAAYDRQLKEQFGLFAMYPRSTEAMEQEMFELLSQNLNEGALADGVSDLYGFNVLKVDVIPIYNLSEPFVLKKQAAEFMKYRAPAQVVQEFYEKLKLMVGLKKEAELIDKKMKLDSLMKDIRSSLVILHFMINDKLQLFNKESNGSSGTLKDKLLGTVKSNVEKASGEIHTANEEVEPIKTACNAYNNHYQSYKTAEINMQSAQNTFDAIRLRLEKIELDLEKAKEKAIQADITNLEADRADALEEYQKAQSSLTTAQTIYRDIESDFLQCKREVEERTQKAINALNTAMFSMSESAAILQGLVDHITMHALFHSDLLNIVDSLAPQLAEMEQASLELQNAAQSQQSSVSEKISGDIEKQVKSIKKDTYTEISQQLSKNLERLKAWKQAAEACKGMIDKTSSDISAVKMSAEVVKAAPENANNSYNGYSGFSQAENGISDLEKSLSDLKALGKMQGVYAIPPYSLEPEPNAIEKDSFNQWFNEKYNGYEKVEEPPSTDDTELKAIRSGITGLAGVMAEKGGRNSTEEDNSGISLVDHAERASGLPTKTGSISSVEKLRQIGDAITVSDANSINVEGPLDKTVEGIDKVDENNTKFFTLELKRITELLEALGKFVADGIECIAEDLYFNEYIVSCFENAANEDLIEHDIGWQRPLDKSFFKKAEVEYIIFGKASEKANITAARTSIFSVRLLFNLLHVYTDPDKLAATLQLATSIAGWTIFGIPVVQNFLLIGWAGAESYVDTDILSLGNKVPLIKTSNSWCLSMETLADYLKNIILKDVKQLAVSTVHERVDQLSNTIRDTVMSLINSKVDAAFGMLEKSLSHLITEAGETIQNQVDSMVKGVMAPVQFDSMDTLSAIIEASVQQIIGQLTEKLKTAVPEEIEKYKIAIKDSIESFIFESDLYLQMVDKLKKTGDDLITKGISAVEGQIDKAFGMAGKSRSDNITARLVLMDYTDYLRLFLLSVPAEKKALRAADLMQLNLQQVSGKNDLSIGQYNTYVFIKAEMDFNTWFLPESLFKKNGAGMISIEWSQGY